MANTRKQLNFTLLESDKEILRVAARLEGKTLEAFVRDAALQVAEERREERIRRGVRGDD